MSQTLHFKNKNAYQKWLAYGHIHRIFTQHRKTSKYPKVKLHGKKHKVTHRSKKK